MNYEPLRDWFLKNRRALPWRENPTPYRVFISEMMLQQTQAQVVIPYFIKWMNRFPTIKILAEADLEEVIKYWEGLGYYSRARYIYQAAQVFYREFRGEIPSDPNILYSIKGFGRYTVGAILSFGYKRKFPAIDANVARVLARLFCIRQELTGTVIEKILAPRLMEDLPEIRPWEIMEALIELGAVICRKKPDCMHCPLKANCLGHKIGIMDELPIKKLRPKITVLHRVVPIITVNKKYLMRKNIEGLMKDLWEFPYFSRESNGSLEKEKGHIMNLLGIDVTASCKLPFCVQHFTRYRAYLYPRIWLAQEEKKINGFEWLALEDLSHIACSSGHRKIIKMVFKA